VFVKCRKTLSKSFAVCNLHFFFFFSRLHSPS